LGPSLCRSREIAAAMLDTPCTVLSPIADCESDFEHPTHAKKPAIIAGQIALI
jgi:hypothetical protein